MFLSVPVVWHRMTMMTLNDMSISVAPGYGFSSLLEPTWAGEERKMTPAGVQLDTNALDFARGLT